MIADLEGKQLGQYTLRQIVHRGSIMHNYAAYQPTLERTVLVQTLTPQLRQDTAYNHALHEAAKIIAELEHPNILPILDVGVQDDITYLVMRLLKGPSLKERLTEGPLTLAEANTVLRHIGDALAYVHSLGRVHGDPGALNIMFDHWGSAYLIDFIIAGFMQQQTETSGGLLGIPLYMAPERWLEQGSTPASDQYALGVIAYEMLTGTPPFNPPELMALMYQHTNEPVPDPRTHREDIPPATFEVFQRVLAKTPQERYPSIATFVHALEQALNAQPEHLFISYSRANRDYIQQLKSHLIHNALPVWSDEKIEHGDHWFNEINNAIKNSAAVLVVMSPEAEQSEWVQKEILLAKRYKKPIFPLLLEGDEFPILIDIQFEDVKGSVMPGEAFYQRISRVLGTDKKPVNAASCRRTGQCPQYGSSDH